MKRIHQFCEPPAQETHGAHRSPHEILIAEHIASKVPESRFEEIHRKYPYSDKGKTCIPLIYQRAIGDAEAGKRASKVKAELATLDPWDPESGDQGGGNLVGDALSLRSFGEEQKARLAALRGRPTGSDPEQSSTMQREEVLEQAPFPAEPMRPLPTDKMFVGDTCDLRVGFT